MLWQVVWAKVLIALTLHSPVGPGFSRIHWVVCVCVCVRLWFCFGNSVDGKEQQPCQPRPASYCFPLSAPASENQEEALRTASRDSSYTQHYPFMILNKDILKNVSSL